MPIEIIFVSGLYGLLLWDEPIQDYDCHFADYTLGSNPKTIKEKWGSVLTDALIELINNSGRSGRGGKITRVYDLLSDSYYQSVVAWERISGVNVVGSRVYHRIFAAHAATDALSKIATVLVRYLDRLCDSATPKFNDWVTLTSAAGVTFDFGFEQKIGANQEAAREGLLLTRKRVLDRDGWLTELPRRAFDQWILAEYAWRQVQTEEQCDFGAMVVSFTKAVEEFFRLILSREIKKENASLNDIIGVLSTRKFAHLGLTTDVRDLKGFRDRGAHSYGPTIKRCEVPKARELALGVLRRAVSARI